MRIYQDESIKFPKEMKQLSLIVTPSKYHTNYGNGEDYYHMNAYIGLWDSVNERLTSTYQIKSDSLGLEDFIDDFQIHAQAEFRDTRNENSEPSEALYGWRSWYKEIHHADAAKARAMHFMLWTIRRKTEKLIDAEGTVKTFGQYCGRVARILGLRSIVVQRSLVGLNRGVDYDYREYTLGAGADQIDFEYKRWRDAEIESRAPH